MTKLHAIIITAFIAFSCSQPARPEVKAVADTLIYLNHSPDAKYVGMETCRQCHQGIYDTYIKTGMGQSFALASRQKSSASFTASGIYDSYSDLHYRAFWTGDSLYMNEYRMLNKDTIHSRTEQVNFIIGSGQHTNSHLRQVNGYITQMPMTYYTQQKKWDLPPGFEDGVNTRFSRKIGLECMSCHNAYPDFVMGSENKFNSVPQGIDCERCHGPGSIHAEERKNNPPVDTARYIDRSIVNPAKLSISAQFDICQRCHLQGNTVLKNGHSFYDFRPGQNLSDYISVFRPKYTNSEDEFIMASHAERLKQSRCFIKSIENASGKSNLKPYKDALTCVTCHNPHISVKETNGSVFNAACEGCHSGGKLTGEAAGKTMQVIHKAAGIKDFSNCVSCHMPLSGSTDIPHVTVHDHYIRKPVSKKEKEKIKTFMGLYSVNEKKPSALTRAMAYISQYSKFDQEAAYLDSAEKLLKDEKNVRKKIYALIQLYFVKQDFRSVIMNLDKAGRQFCYDTLFTRRSFENNDAWASYRIAESFNRLNELDHALSWFNRAVELSPFYPEFRNKLGSAYAAQQNYEKAITHFEILLKENPRFGPAYGNLGYLKLVTGFPAEAIRLYQLGLKLEPDNEPLLLNMAGYYIYMKEQNKAAEYLRRLLKINPGNKQAREVLKQLNS